MATETTTTSRRNFLAVAAIASVSAPAIASTAEVDPIDVLAAEFERASTELSHFEIKYYGVDTPEINEEYQRVYGRVDEYIDRIRIISATDLKTLRLKARAFLWCNEGIHFGLDPCTDMKIAKSIIENLLALPTI